MAELLIVLVCALTVNVGTIENISPKEYESNNPAIEVQQGAKIRERLALFNG